MQSDPITLWHALLAKEVIDRLAAIWGKMGESGQRIDTALDMLNEARYVQGVARDELQQLIDELHGPQGQGD